MASKPIGIRGNAIFIKGYGMYDPRGVREVEATRDLSNRKPYRTKAQKTEARAKAWKRKDGTWQSSAPVSMHPEVRR